MDKLKQYLQEGRELLDVEVPPADLWTVVHAKAAAAAWKAIAVKYIITISVVALVGSAVWWMVNTQKHTPMKEPESPQKELVPKDTVREAPADTAAWAKDTVPEDVKKVAPKKNPNAPVERREPLDKSKDLTAPADRKPVPARKKKDNK
jgi:hypothetical protein